MAGIEPRPLPSRPLLLRGVIPRVLVSGLILIALAAWLRISTVRPKMSADGAGGVSGSTDNTAASSGVSPHLFAGIPANQSAAAGDPSAISPRGESEIANGVRALEGNHLSEAVGAFERAVASDPRSPRTHDYLGIAYLRQGRFDAAMKQFKEEIRLDPDPSTGWARISDIYYAKRNVKEAIRALEQAAALRPDRAQLHYNLGMLYPHALDLNKGVDSLRRYNLLEPANHYAHYLLGSLLYKLARLDEAELSLNESIKLAPNVGIYHFALAQVHFRRTASSETTERARTELQKALDNGTPEPAAVHYYLGLCYQRQGDAESARRALQESVQIAPEAWGAYYALAEALQKLGRIEEARKARARFAVLRAKEDLRMRRSYYKEEVERNPESAIARYQLASFLLGQGDRRAAGEALKRARGLAGKKTDDAGLRKRIAALAAELGRSRGR